MCLNHQPRGAARRKVPPSLIPPDKAFALRKPTLPKRTSTPSFPVSPRIQPPEKPQETKSRVGHYTTSHLPSCSAVRLRSRRASSLPMTESDKPPSEARPSETEPLDIERLESVFEPAVPSRRGIGGAGRASTAPARASPSPRPCAAIGGLASSSYRTPPSRAASPMRCGSSGVRASNRSPSRTGRRCPTTASRRALLIR